VDIHGEAENPKTQRRGDGRTERGRDVATENAEAKAQFVRWKCLRNFPGARNSFRSDMSASFGSSGGVTLTGAHE
jgi:hypothetical protein